MMHLSHKEYESYSRLRKATDKKEIEKINAELKKIALEEAKKYEHLPFA